MALTKRQRKDRLRHGDQRKIAKKLGLSESTVSQVMNRKTQTLTRETILRVQIAIAEEIGEPLEEVFSDAVVVAA